MSIALYILAGLVGAVVTGVSLWFIALALGWRSTLQFLQGQYGDSLRVLAETEREKTLIEHERDHLKTFMETFINKPVQAVLHDQQFHQLLQMLDARIKFQHEETDEPTPKRRPN